MTRLCCSAPTLVVLLAELYPVLHCIVLLPTFFLRFLVLQVGAALLTHPVTVLGYVTQVAAVQQAALAGETVKSLLTNTLLPTILWVQQSNCLLSFRLALFFQLGLFGVAVAWAQGMPCYLPLPTAPAGSGNWSCNSTHFAAQHMAHMAPLVLTPPAGSCMPCNSSAVLEPAGKVHAGLGQHAVAAAHAGVAFALQESSTRACQGMQLLHELLLVPFGGVAVAPAVGRATLCDGAAAFQTLFVFVAALLLLVVVPASVYFIELHYKQKWLKRNGITVVPNCSVQAAPGSASSSSQAQLRWQPWRPVLSTHALLALPVCCCWALSESVSAWIGGCCMVPMGNGAIAWMSSWF